jgi:hypothetical protein
MCLRSVAAADLILHVRDIAHPDSEAQAADVEAVLSSLGLAEEDLPPRIEVWNKSTCPARRQTELPARRNAAATSSRSRPDRGRGRRPPRGFTPASFRLADPSGPAECRRRRAIAWLHARGEVLEQQHDGDRLQLSVKLSPENWARLNGFRLPPASFWPPPQLFHLIEGHVGKPGALLDLPDRFLSNLRLALRSASSGWIRNRAKLTTANSRSPTSSSSSSG